MSDEETPVAPPVKPTKAAAAQKPSIGRIVLVNPHGSGDPTIAFVVKVWSDTCVNLLVFGDGGSYHTQTSVVLGTAPGEWSWPPRV